MAKKATKQLKIKIQKTKPLGRSKKLTDSPKGINPFYSRVCKDYKQSLKELLKEFILIGRKEPLDNYCSKLKQKLLSNEDAINVNYEKNKKLTHCLSIDFSGFSSSTLLFSYIAQQGVENNKEILDLFKDLISNENCVKLNGHGIYLRVRFLFAYLYSEMPFSLMKACENRERLRSRREEYINQEKFTDYDFNKEPGLEEAYFNDSIIRDTQIKSLKVLARIVPDSGLEFKLPYEANNTIEVRFTPLPVPFCMLKINRVLFMDTYAYSKQEHVNDLSYTIPLLRIEIDKIEKVDLSLPPRERHNYYHNFYSHFHYLWYHDLTILGEDAGFELKKEENLMREPDINLKMPFEIKWEQKEKMIKKELIYHKVDQRAYDDDGIRIWKNNLINRFNRTTKLPFNYSKPDLKTLTIMFTDFKGFTRATEGKPAGHVVEILEDCYRAFDRICQENGLTKIKTIGDSYMCVSGDLFDKNNDIRIVMEGAKNTIQAGKQMIDYYHNNKEMLRDEHGILFDGMRVGVNTGKVIVLQKQMTTDVFGGPVNYAQRMEQQAKENTVNISQETNNYVSNAIKTVFNGQHVEKDENGNYIAKEGESFKMWTVVG